ncbi:MAG TPA: hypothetical protein VMR00_19480 [Streptosporangiaceae bacterium]|jgi:hypothetical protein|nr:hypothetical protein [Streptosporangiaceae bacterium]
MTSSDGHRAAGHSGAAAEPGADAAAGADAGRGAEPDTAQWFLPAGRAGLPDSMTVSPDDEEPAGRPAGPSERAAAVSAPPWAGDPAVDASGTPPPWENGPWPGPEGGRPSRPASSRPGARASGGVGASASASAGSGPGPGGDQAGTARRILIAGLVPLVVPGLVAGILGLRESPPGGPVRRAAVTAIAASLAWAVVIVVVVIAVSSGGSGAACTYPAAVHQAFARAMTDISTHAPGQAADLTLAVSRANASAAAAGQIPVRNALFALAGDLELARGDVTAGRAVPGTLRAHLAADGSALTRACPS